MEKFKVSFEANNQQLKSIGTKHASDTYADIEAEFVLGNRWTDMDSVSAVWWNDFTRIATVLDSQGKCVVPHEVLTRKGCVRVNLVGSIVEGDELITRLTSYSAEAVQVNEKIKLTGSETSELTPSQFEQFVTEVKADADRAETVRDEAEAARDVAVSAKDTAVNAVEGFEDIVDTATATAVQTIQGEGATQVTAIQTEGTTQVASVRTEGSTQVTAVQDKGDEVLDSIPDDYTQLSQDVTDLKSAISNNMFLLKDAIIDLKDVNVWEQGTISSSGEITSAHNMSNIYTPSLLTFPIKYEIGLHQAIYLAKYKNGSFVSRSKITSGNIDFDSTFDSYRLMVVGNASTYTVAEMVSQFEYMESLYKRFYDGNISNIINGVKTSWQDGVVGSNGTISSGSNDNYYSDLISREYFKSIEIKTDAGYMFSICKYNGTSFVERSSWYGASDGVVSVNDNYDYRINIAKSSASGSTLEQMLEHFLINVNGDDIPTLRREAVPKSNLNYLNKMFSTYTPNKICHYSVDDTYALLKDLTDNAGSYTSIFDNATLAELKSIHEATGMCVTLNTFNTFSEVPSYSISNVPEKTAFQTEFQANKGWLRFAFHAEDDTSNYNTSNGISSAYDAFVSAIYKLTGDYGCIDRITRLGFFNGSLANVLTIKNKTYGVIGLLCADTTNRDSYYLSTDQNKTVQQKGLLLDLDNELVFIKTITRNLGSDAENEILNNLSYQKYVELFSHEYEGGWLTYCRSMCQWAKDHGYVFAFPSDILG